MAGGSGTKEIATRYPCVEGLTAGTTKRYAGLGKLVAQQGSTVSVREKALF